MADTTLVDVQHWIALHHQPGRPSVSLASRGPQFRNLAAALDSASGATVAAVPSAAAVSGPDGAAAASAADAALKAAGSDIEQKTKVLREHPISGCTSVMDLALKHSGYNALLPATEGNFTAYISYVKSITTCPLMHLNYADQRHLTESVSNWDNLINSIVAVFEGIQSQDRGRIVESLKQLAHTATSTKDKTQTLNVFSQQAISVNTSQITVGIYNSSVSMIEHSGKHTTSQSDYYINRAFLTFNTETWAEYAGQVARATTAGVGDWLTEMNSLPQH